MFDFVTVEDGKIADRIQQPDMFGPLRRRVGPLLLTLMIGLSRVLFVAGIVIGELAR